MEKRKEIKWRRTGSFTLEGRQDGVQFVIHEKRPMNRTRADGTNSGCYVSARDTKGQGRDISTVHHRTFTKEEAKEFCQAIMAGEVDLEAMRISFAAEEAARERRAIRQATAEAKAFRAEMEKAGISYAALLDLMDLQQELSSLAHDLLLGFERGEGWPMAAEGPGVCQQSTEQGEGEHGA